MAHYGMAKRIRSTVIGPIALALTAITLSLWLTGLGSAADAQTFIDPPSDDLTVVMTEFEPFVVNSNGRADGFYAEIWDLTADELGVDYDVIWVDSFAELLTSVDAGEAEVAVAPLSPTAEREARYDFSSSVISSGPQLGYHERIAVQRSLIGALASRAVRQILLFAVLGLTVLAHLIWLVERDRDDEEGQDFHPSYLRGIWDGFWWATVTVTTVGYGDKAPRSVPGRIIALLAMLLSLFLVGAFVSQVTDILQERRDDAVISSLSDARDTPVGAIAGSSFAAYVESQGVEVVGYDSQTELFEAVGDGEVDVIVTNPFALASVGPDYGVRATGSVLYEEFETFGLAQDSPWREPINQVLAELQAAGEFEQIVDRWIN